MIFTSWAFVLFFLVILACLSFAPTRSSRQIILLVGSVYFYSFWDYRFLLVLAAPGVVDYVCAVKIADSRTPGKRRFWLTCSLVTNLGLLGFFKYTNFLLGSVNSLTGARFPFLNIILPVGISFFTFKTLSYTIDVYRREIEPCRSPWKYAMFITYFPELVAGPIVRASVFLPQMSRSLRPSLHRLTFGSQIVLIGLTKKLVIADRLATFVDPVFLHPEVFSQSTVLAAVIAYSLQIYCDFSGYSDMAIGISRIIGFDLPENFNMPYAAKSVSDFWRRWHMTLSQWLRDYLYIPLGGNRRGSWRTSVNLMATMLLGGLWHGASWNFVIWGGLHGAGLMLHKRWSRTGRSLWTPVAWLVTYAFVCLTWIFFRANNLADSMLVLRKCLGLEAGGVSWTYSPLFALAALIVAAHVVGSYAERLTQGARKHRYVRPPRALQLLYAGNGYRFAIRPHGAAGLYVLLPVPSLAAGLISTAWLVVLFFFSALDTSPFIYFQF